MKRLLKLLARLYPSAWRNRYGAEYEALLDDATPRPQDAFNVLWVAIKMQLASRSFVRIVLPCAIAGALIATAISLAIPPHYVSQTIFLAKPPSADGVCEDQNHLPAELRGPKPGVCVDKETFNRYLKDLNGKGFSREFLASVIQERNLYVRERAHVPFDEVIDRMRKNIQVTSSGKDVDISHFVLRFDYPEPHVAQQVNNELAIHVAELDDSAETLRFLKEQLLYTDGITKDRIEAKIEQVQAWRERPPSSPGRARMFFNATSLAQKPNGLSRTQVVTIGLLTGLLCGLIIAAITGSRHKTNTASN